MTHGTIILNQSEVIAALDMRGALAAVDEVFRLHGRRQVQMPPKVYLDLPGGDVRAMPAYAAPLGFAAVKNINMHPGNRGIPSIIGTLTLFEPQTGFPLAIMDATAITRMRTGAASGVATRLLARADASVLSVIGAGNQAYTQVEAILLVRPRIEHVLVHDVDTERANAFARAATDRFGVVVRIAATAEEAVRAADILTTITPARVPIVQRDWVKPGTHINAIGADAAGKQELASALTAAARVVVDDLEQATHSGEINVPLTQRLFSESDIYAELGHVVAGAKPGRQNSTDITIFDSTGLALQDLACAAHVYRKITSSGQELRRFDFLQ
ncbi:MAG: ornithine cyclodeaminase family protein [Povalibacter sp.]